MMNNDFQSFKQFMNSDMETDIDILDESGNISSGMAIKIQNDIIRLGRDAIKARRVEDKINFLAKQNGALSGLVLMSIAVSGDESFLGRLSRGLSMRKV